MDGAQNGWHGRTFVQRIDAIGMYPLPGGYASRLWLMGDFTLTKLYIGPVSARDPWIAAHLYQMSFNSGLSKGASPTVADDGSFVAVPTDPLPIGLDGSRGIIITGYIDPGGNGIVATQSRQMGFSSRYALSDLAADVDKRIIDAKSPYTDTTAQYNAIVVQMFEGYYSPPTPWSTGVITPAGL